MQYLCLDDMLSKCVYDMLIDNIDAKIIYNGFAAALWYKNSVKGGCNAKELMFNAFHGMVRYFQIRVDLNIFIFRTLHKS